MSTKFDSVIKKFLIENETPTAPQTSLAQSIKNGGTGTQGAKALEDNALNTLAAIKIANPSQAENDPKQLALNFSRLIDKNETGYNWQEFVNDHEDIATILAERGAPITTDNKDKKETPPASQQEGGKQNSGALQQPSTSSAASTTVVGANTPNT